MRGGELLEPLGQPLEAPTVTYELELRDFRAQTAYACAPTKPSLGVQLGLGMAAGVVISVIALAFVESPPSFYFGVFVGAALLWTIGKVILLRVQARAQPTPGGCLLCRYTVTLTPQGIEMSTPHWDAVTRWSGVMSVDETPDHVFLRIDKIGAYSVPKRAFSDGDAMRVFVQTAKANLPARLGTSSA